MLSYIKNTDEINQSNTEKLFNFLNYSEAIILTETRILAEEISKMF